MDMEDNQFQGMVSVMEQWMNQATQVWQGMLKGWPDASFGEGAQVRASEPPDKGKGVESEGEAENKWRPERFQLDAAFKNWQSFISSMAEPGTQASMFTGMQTAPLAFSNMAETSLKVFADIQKSFADQLRKGADLSAVRDFSNVDTDILGRWSDFYEKELKKVITVPQFGLGKFRQEKINRMTDRFTAYQLALTQFLNLLTQPLQESAKLVLEKTTESMDRRELPSDPKAIYRDWIRILEALFMKLLKSEEFLENLQKAMTTSLEFHSARKEVLEEVLDYFSLPTGRELDDVYRDLYTLKKEVRKKEAYREVPVEAPAAELEIELKKDGDPFKTVESAKNSLIRRRMQKSYEVVKVKGGYGLKKRTSDDRAAGLHG